MKKGSVNKELENLSPELSDLKRRGDGFRLPEGYFEGLEDAVFSRIDATGSRRRPAFSTVKGGGLRSWLFRPRMMIAAAAVFAIVLTAKWFFIPKPVPAVAPAPVAAQQLSEEEMIEAYVLENIRDFDVNQLAAYAPENEKETVAKPEEDQHIKQRRPLDGLSPEEVDMLLKEMSDEELESML